MLLSLKKNKTLFLLLRLYSFMYYIHNNSNYHSSNHPLVTKLFKLIEYYHKNTIKTSILLLLTLQKQNKNFIIKPSNDKSYADVSKYSMQFTKYSNNNKNFNEYSFVKNKQYS